MLFIVSCVSKVLWRRPVLYSSVHQAASPPVVHKVFCSGRQRLCGGLLLFVPKLTQSCEI